jgi:hypothetical protein
MRKYNYIYQTTNLINGKIYIGKHSTDNINDGYMGSGVNLTKSIKKYGKENFIKTILHLCSNEQEAFDKEKELVNESFVQRKDSYNIAIGGGGSKSNGSFRNPRKKCINGMKNKIVVKDFEGKIFVIDKNDYDKMSNMSLIWTGRKHSEDTKIKQSFVKKKMFEEGKLKPLCGKSNGMYGKRHSPDNIEKMRNYGKISMTPDRKEILREINKNRKGFWDGKNLDSEHKDKIRTAMMGKNKRNKTQEERDFISKQRSKWIYTVETPDKKIILTHSITKFFKNLNINRSVYVRRFNKNIYNNDDYNIIKKEPKL